MKTRLEFTVQLWWVVLEVTHGHRLKVKSKRKAGGQSAEGPCLCPLPGASAYSYLVSNAKCPFFWLVK